MTLFSPEQDAAFMREAIGLAQVSAEVEWLERMIESERTNRRPRVAPGTIWSKRVSGTASKRASWGRD